MPGFWDQLQQYAVQDAQRAEANESRKMGLLQMLSGMMQSNADRDVTQLQAQNAGLLQQSDIVNSMANRDEQIRQFNEGNVFQAAQKNLDRELEYNLSALERAHQLALQNAKSKAEIDQINQEAEAQSLLLRQKHSQDMIFAAKNPDVAKNYYTETPVTNFFPNGGR